jgi:hypothetical protein
MALFSIFEDSDPLTKLLIHNPMYLKQKYTLSIPLIASLKHWSQDTYNINGNYMQS